MMQFKEITSENPIADIWNLLRLFSDPNITSEQICTLHQIENPKKGVKDNIQRKAKQIGYCIKQAEEYFTAASAVGISTRPLLLYYGIVSLSQALVLFKQGVGDDLRQLRNQNHHGLNPSGSYEEIKVNGTISDFLSSIQVQINANKDKPWGQFCRFYDSLIPDSFRHEIFKNSLMYTAVINSDDIVAPQDNLLSQRFNLKDIVTYLPDAYVFFPSLGFKIDLYPITKMKLEIRDISDENGPSDNQNVSTRYFVNRILPQEQYQLIKSCNEEITNKYQDCNILTIQNGEDYISFEICFNNIKISEPIFVPAIIESITGERYTYKPSNWGTKMPEPALYFIIAFCFGWLVRYYPDKWVEATSKNVAIAQGVEVLLNVMQRKFPNAILDQMTNTKHYIHH